jgi:tRNA (guanine37-N1)-methyltransferase
MSIVDEEVSIGDYVLTGGELAALVIIDATARLVPGVLGDEESPKDESFAEGLLEYPQWTRPRQFRGMQVPEVLLSGNHQQIQHWRRKEAIRRTLNQRPELLLNLKDKDIPLLKEVLEEEGPEWVERVPEEIKKRLLEGH